MKALLPITSSFATKIYWMMNLGPQKYVPWVQHSSATLFLDAAFPNHVEVSLHHPSSLKPPADNPTFLLQDLDISRPLPLPTTSHHFPPLPTTSHHFPPLQSQGDGHCSDTLGDLRFEMAPRSLAISGQHGRPEGLFVEPQPRCMSCQGKAKTRCNNRHDPSGTLGVNSDAVGPQEPPNRNSLSPASWITFSCSWTPLALDALGSPQNCTSHHTFQWGMVLGRHVPWSKLHEILIWSSNHHGMELLIILRHATATAILLSPPMKMDWWPRHRLASARAAASPPFDWATCIIARQRLPDGIP